MSKLMIVITLFVMTLGFVGITLAEDPAKAKATKLSGEVTAVDAQAKTVTVKGKGNKEVTLMVTDKSIAQGKEKKTLADIQPGTKVSTTYITEGDKMTAKAIHIAAPKK